MDSHAETETYTWMNHEAEISCHLWFIYLFIFKVLGWLFP